MAIGTTASHRRVPSGPGAPIRGKTRAATSFRARLKCTLAYGSLPADFATARCVATWTSGATSRNTTGASNLHLRRDSARRFVHLGRSHITMKGTNANRQTELSLE